MRYLIQTQVSDGWQGGSLLLPESSEMDSIVLGFN
jgi:hypothetical protein